MSGLTLRNCAFAFECSATWDRLTPTLLDRVRFCEHCCHDVHRCDTDAELLNAIREDLCVAIDDGDQPEKLPGRRMLVGSMRATGITFEMPKLKDSNA